MRNTYYVEQLKGGKANTPASSDSSRGVPKLILMQGSLVE